MGYWLVSKNKEKLGRSMLRKFIAFILFLVILVVFFLNAPRIVNSADLKILAQIENEKLNLFDKKFQLNSIIYWNRINKVTKVSSNYNFYDIFAENSIFYNGKDFLLSKEQNQFFVIDKKTEGKKYLADAEIALTSKDSNLFALVKKNGLEISFFQFVPLENRAIEIKKEVFSCFWTDYKITKNSFYFSLMNGNCYIFNPFELISSESVIKDSPFIYSISANSSSNNFIIISGFEPQKIYLLNKDGNILYQSQLNENYTSVFSYLLDNQMLIIKNPSSLLLYKIYWNKEKKLELLNNINIKGEILDLVEFYSYFVFICSDTKDFQLAVYDYKSKRFYKKNLREPIYQIEMIDSNGVFAVYNQDKLWILSMNQEL